MSSYLHHVITVLLWSHFSTLWPIFLAPFLVAALLRLTVCTIDAMPAGSAAQRWLSFLASIMPGVVFWCAAFSSLSQTRIMMPFAWHSAGCMAHCVILSMVLAAVPLHAGLPFLRQHLRLGHLLGLKQAPSPRLRQAASDLGLQAWELPTLEPLCCIAGIFKPRLLVSTGALSALADDELHAALLHERAHMHAHETFWVSIAALFNRASLLACPRSLQVFRKAGEYAADREASRQSDPAALASALLRLSRPASTADGLAINLAAGENVLFRARLLVYGQPARKAGLQTPMAIISLILAASVAFLPYAVHLAAILGCH